MQNGIRSRASGLAGFTSMYADLGDLTIHFVTGGDGPPVVLLHGFAQTWRAWRAVMPALAEHYRVIVPDLRGIGGSTVTFGGFDKRTMAGDVAALLGALDIPSASVVGHDIGGMVAYAFAKSYPDHISKLGIAAVLLPEQTWYQWPLLDPRTPWWFRFHALPLVPERLISASLTFYLDWFFDFHDPGQNYDASGITAADRKAYAEAYSAPGALSAALGWFRAFPSRLWAGIGTRIARHPAPAALVIILVLGAACTGLASLRIGNNLVDNVKGNAGSVVGQQLLNAHFPAGASDPLVLLVPPGQARAAAAAAQATPDVAAVQSGAPVQGYDSYQVTLEKDPFGRAGETAIVSLRQRLGVDAPAALVGGNPAIAYDETQTAGRGDVIIVPLVLAVILVVIALLLQAIVAPVVLVLTTALSFAASFGLSSLLWRHGLGYPGVESILPIYIFIFLVALGVD